MNAKVLHQSRLFVRFSLRKSDLFLCGTLAVDVNQTVLAMANAADRMALFGSAALMDPAWKLGDVGTAHSVSSEHQWYTSYAWRGRGRVQIDAWR